MVALAGGLAGAGLLLVVRGLVGATTPLAALVAELHRPRLVQVPVDHRGLAVRWLAGSGTPSRDADLAVCERDLARWVQDRLVWSLLLASPGLALVLLSVAGGVAPVSPFVAVSAACVGAIAGWFYARFDLASDADIVPWQRIQISPTQLKDERLRRSFLAAIPSRPVAIFVLCSKGDRVFEWQHLKAPIPKAV